MILPATGFLLGSTPPNGAICWGLPPRIGSVDRYMTAVVRVIPVLICLGIDSSGTHKVFGTIPSAKVNAAYAIQLIPREHNWSRSCLRSTRFVEVKIRRPELLIAVSIEINSHRIIIVDFQNIRSSKGAYHG